MPPAGADVLANTPALATRYYVDSPDDAPPPELAAALDPIPWVRKRGSDVMEADGFAPWLEERLAEGVRTLVVCGCTTTSCVRVSSQSVHRAYAARGLRVVVDLSLCGARLDNHDRDGRAAEDEVLLREYGEEVGGRSAVDLALLQMRRSGVALVEEYPWCRLNGSSGQERLPPGGLAESELLSLFEDSATDAIAEEANGSHP
eukprot:COSAG04_NODE_196_length_20686_cov_2.719823_1_plen_203_part_00